MQVLNNEPKGKPKIISRSRICLFSQNIQCRFQYVAIINLNSKGKMTSNQTDLNNTDESKISFNRWKFIWPSFIFVVASFVIVILSALGFQVDTFMINN